MEGLCKTWWIYSFLCRSSCQSVFILTLHNVVLRTKYAKYFSFFFKSLIYAFIFGCYLLINWCKMYKVSQKTLLKEKVITSLRTVFWDPWYIILIDQPNNHIQAGSMNLLLSNGDYCYWCIYSIFIHTQKLVQLEMLPLFSYFMREKETLKLIQF